MSTAPWTVGRLLQWTVDYLKAHGSDSPRLDTELLLAQAMGCKKIELYTRFEEEPKEDVRAAFRELVKRRGEGEPVAYLIGHREFYSLDFRVTPDVLIPRPETEHVVVALLDLAKPKDAPWSIADIGTGSGILAICAAKSLPAAQVAAVDISPAALAVARENAEKHGVAGRIEFLGSDLFAAVPAERKFDFIVSNPPYVADGDTTTLAANVRKFEPHAALFGGPTGSEVINRLIPQAADRLKTGGHLLMEISPMVEEDVRNLITTHGGLELSPTVKDLARQPRVVHAMKM